MKTIFKTIVVSILLILLTACKKGGSKDDPTNHKPIAISATYSVDGSSIDIKLKVTDEDGDKLTYEITKQPKHGSLKGKAPSLTYTPQSDYNGTDSFSYTANDGKENSNEATITLNIVSSGGSDDDNYKAKVLKTGQTESYIDFDDGYYQKGTERSYSRDNTKEIVTDNATGLMWQDNEEAKTVLKPWITKANWDAGDYNNTSGDTATTYCANLSLGGYDDWRLPTIKELETIVYYSKTHPIVDTEYFKNVSDGLYSYWSSTVSLANTKDEYVWNVYFRDGYTRTYRKDNIDNVRCVRDAR